MGFTGWKNDIGAGTDTDFIGACTPALSLRSDIKHCGYKVDYCAVWFFDNVSNIRKTTDKLITFIGPLNALDYTKLRS